MNCGLWGLIVGCDTGQSEVLLSHEQTNREILNRLLDQQSAGGIPGWFVIIVLIVVVAGFVFIQYRHSTTVEMLVQRVVSPSKIEVQPHMLPEAMRLWLEDRDISYAVVINPTTQKYELLDNAGQVQATSELTVNQYLLEDKHV